MKKIYTILIIIAMISACKKEEPLKISYDSVVYDNDEDRVYYLDENNDTIPFTGIVYDSLFVEDDEEYTMIANVKNGYFDGDQTLYFKNGKIYQSTKVKDNKEEGRSYGNYKNGQLRYEGNYINDKRNGKWIWYHENGVISNEREFKDGKKEGPYSEYSKNGELQVEGMYKNDMKNGKWIWYNENGVIRTEREYKNDSYLKICDCCGNEFWSEKGWSPVPSGFSTRYYNPKQDGGPYCCKKCAIECRGNGWY